MKRLAVFASILFLIASCTDRRGSDSTAATVNDLLSAIPAYEELTCNGAGTKCTSKFAFVCIKGWSACPLEGDNKTCCKKD